jgi:fructose-1,6-bisphosphatase/inositol monophosphatase family enzyme
VRFDVGVVCQTAELKTTIRGCLRAIDDEYRELERAGHTSTIADRSTDFATTADKRLTDTIREYFSSQPATYRVLSEESSAESNAGDRVVIADEIDGTANMLNGGDAPFGPVLAVAATGDPRFEDVLAAGFLSLQSGDLYEAYRGEGAFHTAGWAESEADIEAAPLSTSGRTAVSGSDHPQILVDQYMLSGAPEVAERCWSVGYPGDFRSWIYHMGLVARGSYDLAVTGDYCALHENKRATAEELAGGYLLVSEAGGTITTWDGTDLGPERIGMAEGRTFDTVVGATEQLAREFARRLPGT